MKIIIIEGPDNCGKSLLISKLIEHFSTITLIHCSKPDFNKKDELSLLYDTYANAINKNKFNTNVLIFNRSWIGEYVYGYLYRNKKLEDIENMILNIEKNIVKNNDVYYIQLISSNIDLLLRNEDGFSLSNNSYEKILNEVTLFKDIFNKSSLKNKKLIYINENDKFRNFNDILNEVFNFLKIC